eukprot:PhF_6_TR25163/c0_g1_i1/m.34682/K17907/ATG9; autophagy-related protein 9
MLGIGRTSSYSEVDSVSREPIKPTNLNEFFVDMHLYWAGRGLRCIMVNTLCELIKSFFVILVVIMFVFIINWEDMMHCHGEACATVSWTVPEGKRDAHGLLILCVIILAVHYTYMLIDSIRYLLRMKRCRDIYTTVLEFPDEQLCTTSWSNAARMLQNKNIEFVRGIDELSVAAFILRYENILLCMLCEDTCLSKIFPTQYRFTAVYEKVLLYIFRRSLFTADNELQSSDVIRYKLRRYSFWIGLLMMLTCPFVITYTIITRVLRYGVELRTEPSTLALRRWSTWAKWVCRDYNEFHDVLEMRLREAYPLVNHFRSHMCNEHYNDAVRLVIFLSSGIAACIMFLTLLNANVLTTVVVVGDLNLLWFLSMSVMVATAARACLVSTIPTGEDKTALGALDKVQTWLHYYFRTHSTVLEVEKDISWNFHVPSYLFFVQELWGLLTLPIFLLRSFPCVELEKDVRQYVTYAYRTGDVCKYSTFNVERGSRYRKMEVSLENFKHSHPEWNGAVLRLGRTKDDEGSELHMRQQSSSRVPSTFSMDSIEMEASHGVPMPQASPRPALPQIPRLGLSNIHPSNNHLEHSLSSVRMYPQNQTYFSEVMKDFEEEENYVRASSQV